MTDDTVTSVDIENDLEAFEEAFSGAKEVVDKPTEADALATDEDKDAPRGDEDESDNQEETEDEDKDSEESEEESEEQPRKKSSVQERINELTRARREAERAILAEREAAARRERELVARLEALEVRKPEVSTQTPARTLPPGAPSPNAVDAQGQLIYPLGEFDPNFIADLSKFTVQQEHQAIRQKEAAEYQRQQLVAAQQELTAEWEEKIAAVEEVNPEIRENITDLVSTFSGIDPAYGEYLAVTIMSAENGPEILDYLSKNIGEAQRIVASGPAAATYMIGRLEASIPKSRSSVETSSNKRVSSAAPPPPVATRGRKGQATVRGDTDNLDAFEREFYPVKK